MLKYRRLIKNNYIVFISLLLTLCFIFPSAAPAFFVRGLYLSDYKIFKLAAELGFNTLAGPSSDTALEYAAKYNLKVMPNFNLKNERDIETAQRIKNDTSILAWCPFDEPDLYNIRTETVNSWRNRLKKVSSEIPIFLTVWSAAKYRHYVNLSDIFVINPYPIVSKKDDNKNMLEKVYKQTSYARSICINKPLYTIIQCFYQLPWWKRAPEVPELHNMVYQSLIGGTDGIIFFAYSINSMDGKGWNIERHPEILSELKKINNELIFLEPVLTRGEDVKNITDKKGHNVPYIIVNYLKENYLITCNPYKKPSGLELYSEKKITSSKRVYSFKSDEYITGKGNLVVFMEKYGFAVLKIKVSF